MIFQYPSKILTTPTQLVTPEMLAKESFQKLLGTMFHWMYIAKGVGLAAPQIGVPYRIFVMDPTGFKNKKKGEILSPKYFINPEFISKSPDEIEVEEGCLSCPGFSHKMKRSTSVTVKCKGTENNDLEVVLNGYEAIIAQHEIDHLDGFTIVDRSPPAKKSIYLHIINQATK